MELPAKPLVSKSTSLSFSPQSWWTDTRTLSLQAKALWFEILLLMHTSPKRGYLLNHDSTAIGAKALAVGLGTTTDVIVELCKELESAGVFSRTAEKIPFSRRMVREQSRIEKELAGAREEDDKSKLDKILKLAKERGIDTAREMNKAQCYLLAHPDKKFSIRFITTWMNKAEPTLIPKSLKEQNSHCSSPPTQITPWGEVNMTKEEWLKAGKPSLNDMIIRQRKERDLAK